MIRLELTRSEAAVLREALSSYLSDLRMEIADTDSLDFRQGLKVNKIVLTEIMERLPAEAELPVESGR